MLDEIALEQESVQDQARFKNSTHLIVSKVAYLLGMSDESMNHERAPEKMHEVFAELENNMPVPQVAVLPEYCECIDIYNEVATWFLGGRRYFSNEYKGTLAEMEESMRYNMGGGLPVAWFYEMKQDVYDTYRFSGVK